MQKPILIFCLFVAVSINAAAQVKTAKSSTGGKKISENLFGLFFEDINYAADGGLYAELVQNRSFEYSPTDKREWNPFSFWQYITPGFSYGSVNIETSAPVHPNNPHYLVLNIEHLGDTGVGIRNNGFDKMPIRANNLYDFSVFGKVLSKEPIKLDVTLQGKRGKILASGQVVITSTSWTKYSLELRATETDDSATLNIIARTKGKLALDVVSLFPRNTFKNHPNGLRNDLAQVIADIKPAFIRFPGGCLAHGDGLGNMYRWKNTIGPVETRVEQKNLWGYHQSMGLGYYEYFQFCEDIGAKPLPVLPAAVSCQNSGGTWRIGGTGQRALPIEEMAEYIQEILDLIEWANGPATSAWGQKRAAAGHPEPFHLEYIGIGNEDKITPEFEQRFRLIYAAVKKQHPEITVIGTAGPFPAGDDYEKGWKLAREISIPVIDEHYYSQPAWFIANQYRYDKYDRNASRVYLGEYASWGNKMKNAISEAAYMTALERNGDVVTMASYAPMLAKKGFMQWNTNMIYFDNTNVYPSVNYYVQQMFSVNHGDRYFGDVISKTGSDSLLAGSCVQDSRSGDIIIKLVNAGDAEKVAHVDLKQFKSFSSSAELIQLSGPAGALNNYDHPNAVVPVKSTYKLAKKFDYRLPPMSLTIIRARVR